MPVRATDSPTDKLSIRIIEPETCSSHFGGSSVSTPSPLRFQVWVPALIGSEGSSGYEVQLIVAVPVYSPSVTGSKLMSKLQELPFRVWPLQPSLDKEN